MIKLSKVATILQQALLSFAQKKEIEQVHPYYKGAMMVKPHLLNSCLKAQADYNKMQNC